MSKQMNYLKGKLIEEEGKKMVAVATDETIDRHGDSLPASAWDLKNFRKNPVLMWAHDYSIPPIGRAKKIRFDGKKMLFEPVFHGLTALSQEVKTLFEADELKAFSVGFIPKRSNKDDSVSLELLEISAVPIPANPMALVIEKTIADFNEEKKAVLNNWFKSFEEDEIDEKDDDTDTEQDGVEEEVVQKQPQTDIQVLSLSKERFSDEASARKWITDHEYIDNDMVETEKAYEFKQFDVEKCDEGTDGTITLSDGVSGVICRVQESQRRSITVPISLFKDVEASLAELRDIIKAFNTLETKDAPDRRRLDGDSVNKGRTPIRYDNADVIRACYTELGKMLRHIKKNN